MNLLTRCVSSCCLSARDVMLFYKEPYISIITDPSIPDDPTQATPAEDIRTRRPDNHEIEIAVSSLISEVDQTLGLVCLPVKPTR